MPRLLSSVCLIALLALSVRVQAQLASVPAAAAGPAAAGAEDELQPPPLSQTPRVAISPQAHARAKQITEEAQAHYEAERYAEAAAAYQRAYAVVPAPELLFNLGQCQRLLARPQLALRYFETYLRLRPKSPQRVLVEQLIAEAKLLQPAAEATEATAAAPQQAPAAPPVQRVIVSGLMPLPAHEVVEPRTRLLTDDGYADVESSTAIYERWWFWTAIVAVAAGAAVTTYLVMENQDDEQPAGTLGTIEWD